MVLWRISHVLFNSFIYYSWVRDKIKEENYIMNLGNVFLKRAFLVGCSLLVSFYLQAGTVAYQLLRYDEDWSFLKENQGNKEEKISAFWSHYKYTFLDSEHRSWLQLGGEMRNRLENWNSYKFDSKLDDTFNLWRFLIHSNIHVNSSLRIYLEGKSALASARSLPGGKRRSDVDQLALQQGFMDFKPMSNNDLTVRVGRQQMAYGSQRLVTIAPWINTMRTWDGVRIINKSKTLSVSAFATQFVTVQQAVYNNSSPSQRFYGVFSTLSKESLPVNVDLYWLFLHKENQLFQGPSSTQSTLKQTDNRNTVGARIFSKKGMQYDIEYAYQFGRWGSRQISAYFIAASVNNKFKKHSLKPSIGAALDIASGGELSDKYTHTFNRLYPAGHKYLGYIDYVSRQNIISPSIKASISPIKYIVIGGAYHHFLRASTKDAVYMANGSVLRSDFSNNDRNVGGEFDAYLKWQASNQANILMGYSVFLPGAFIKHTGNNNQSKYAYLQLTYKV